MRRLVFSLIILATAGLYVNMVYLLTDQADAANSGTSATVAINDRKQLFISYQLSHMTLRQKVSSLLIMHTPGTNADEINNYLTTYQLGGLIFMGNNVPGSIDELATTTSKLQSDTKLPYLLAVDEEGGVVRRLSQDNYSSAIDLKNESPDATEAAFQQRSNLLQQAGLNLNFGIVADVTADSRSFIYQRVFGGDSTAVSERVAAAVKGANGLTLSTLKHFPGHGETESDSHTSVPVTTTSFDQWQQRDMPPFAAGIKAGAKVVMFGHLIYSAVDDAPASLSAKWHNILTNDLGFNGISITDDMGMLQQSGDPNYADPINNSIQALAAGNTMLLFVSNNAGVDLTTNPDALIDGLVAAVNDGRLSQSLIDANVRQTLNIRYDLQ